MDMATRSWSPSIRQLLVELLNEANSEVKKAHNSVAGQAINIKIAKSGGPQNSDNPMDIGFEGEIQLAKPVQDSYDIEQGDVIMEDGSGERAQRKRIKPRRLVDNPTFYKYNFEVAANATSSDYDETDDDASVFSDDSYSSSASTGSDSSSEFDVGARMTTRTLTSCLTKRVERCFCRKSREGHSRNFTRKWNAKTRKSLIKTRFLYVFL